MCHVSHETIGRWVRKFGLVAHNTFDGFAVKIMAISFIRPPHSRHALTS
jgi:hypothetical protein